MGWDYDAFDGPATYHLTLVWGGRLSTALDAFGVFDWEVGPPDAPPSVYEERDEDDPWPFEADLTKRELAYFAFESDMPDKVAGRKFFDNSLWLVTAREAALIADVIRENLDRSVIEELSPDYPATLEEVLRDFHDFARAAARQGGFWAY